MILINNNNDNACEYSDLDVVYSSHSLEFMVHSLTYPGNHNELKIISPLNWNLIDIASSFETNSTKVDTRRQSQ